MPMQVGSFVNDQIANLGNRHEKFGVSPADMLVRVSPNQLRKPDVILTVKGYAEEMINGVEVGFELLDEINLLPRQPVVIDNALWSRHVCWQLIETDGRKTIVLPARSPNLNAYAERWVRSVKEECLSRFILFGERSLRRALQQYEVHYHEKRNHQGRQNLLLFPRASAGACKAEGTIRCRERLGGLLKFYDRQAA